MKISISIESKVFDFQSSDSNNTIFEIKNGKHRSLSILCPTASWLIESLGHPPLAREGWLISRFEGATSTKCHWDSNRSGEFVVLSGGKDRDQSTICIPVGSKSAGINLFIKGLEEAIKIHGGIEGGGNISSSNSLEDAFLLEGEQIQARGMKEEQVTKSISAAIFAQDIGLISRELKATEEGSVTPEQVEEIEKEEVVAQRLFQPAFDAYFETIFRAVVNQIQEALAKNLVLEKLQLGLIHNMSGKTIRATRETVKSMQKVRMACLEGSLLLLFGSMDLNN
ncbi:hypothetical protein DM860_017381 [Cuscuta australis]|uniref:Uncharacterized protein n=1 Tax=Cuscuta australis TaxID=267555 RepID=A0A328DV12_9ASTE|nr:hypothetical protein DM860_017381 [Cuscuta australis]